MMTRTGKIMFAFHGLILVGCTRAGTIALVDGTWPLGLTLTAIAAVCFAALLREVSRAELHEAGRPLPYWLCWMKAKIAARRTSTGCSCNKWWTTAGTGHDDWCPVHGRHYLAEAGDNE